MTTIPRLENKPIHPAFIFDGPASISFSGGKTSAFMLYNILKVYNFKLPENIVVCFANTGKERNETLDFVREIEIRWGVKINWIEWCPNNKFKIVDYRSASRFGEPFEQLINKKKMPPNWRTRFCTQHLKVECMTNFLEYIGMNKGKYLEVIGLRYDEGIRVLKMYERNDLYNRRCYAPLAKAKITKIDVIEFWQHQEFNLNLKDGEGNCDLCFLKGKYLRKSIIKSNARLAEWWIKMEKETGGFFDKRQLYKELTDLKVTKIENNNEEFDTECGLICQTGENE